MTTIFGKLALFMMIIMLIVGYSTILYSTDVTEDFSESNILSDLKELETVIGDKKTTQDLQMQQELLLEIKSVSLSVEECNHNIPSMTPLRDGRSGQEVVTEFVTNNLLVALRDAFEGAGYEVVEESPAVIYISYDQYTPYDFQEISTKGEDFEQINIRKLSLKIGNEDEIIYASEEFNLNTRVEYLVEGNMLKYLFDAWTEEIIEKVRDSLPLINWLR